jgi:hypothetical protein
MKVRILKPIQLSKTHKFGNLNGKEPILLEPSHNIIEVSDKWKERFLKFPDYIEIIEETEDTE